MKSRIVIESVVSLRAGEETEPLNGVYLVAHTFSNGRVLALDLHFDRLVRSAQALGVALDPPRAQLRAVVAKERERLGAKEIRFRITAVLEEVPWYRVVVEPYAGFDPAVRQKGYRCMTVANAARSDAAVKSTAWLHRRAQLSLGETAPGDDPVDEYLLLDSGGRVMEGASSNFFAVLPSGRGGSDELWTPLTGVLPGITRGGVLAVARLPHRDDAVAVDRLAAARECFISSSTRGVVPVRVIDTHSYPVPGDHTADIMAAYELWAQERSEPLTG